MICCSTNLNLSSVLISSTFQPGIDNMVEGMMEEEEKMREKDLDAGERVSEERQNWRRAEVKGRNEPSCERKGSWSRKVGGERRREAFGEEGSRGESCVGGKLESVGGRLQRKGEEGNSLSRSASLPPATRERSRVKRVSVKCKLLERIVRQEIGIKL